jgi:hypothetical protein
MFSFLNFPTATHMEPPDQQPLANIPVSQWPDGGEFTSQSVRDLIPSQEEPPSSHEEHAPSQDILPSQIIASLVPTQSPSQDLQTQLRVRSDLRAFNKVPRVQGQKKKNTRTPTNDLDQPLRKRRSILQELKDKYMGKVLYIDRSDIIEDSADSDDTLEYHVTGLTRKKLDGKMEAFVTLTCVTNKRWTLKDVPLLRFKNRLDMAEQVVHTLCPVVPMDIHAAVSERRLQSRRRLDMPAIDETKEEEPRGVYISDDDNDDGLNDGLDDDGLTFVRRRHGLEIEAEAADNTQQQINDPLLSTEQQTYLNNMEWSRSVHGDVGDDPEASTEQSRPADQFIRECKDPLSCLLQILPHSFWEHIAWCTEKKRKHLVGLQEATEGPSNRHDTKWTKRPIEAERIIVYFGLLLLNTLHTHAGGIKEQWRTGGSMMRPPGRFGLVMPRDEFKTISKYLCMYDIDGDQGNDRHFQLRRVIDMMNNRFKTNFQIGSYVAFDEATLSCRSSYLPGKVYNPNKPHKYGLKLFMLCCSVVGYCYSFEVYQGKKRDEPSEEVDAVNDDAEDDNTTGPIATLRNCKWMQGSHRTVFCDRYYTSVWLFLRLKELQINAVGTIRPNRRGYTDLVKMDKSEISTLKRGSLRMAKHKIQDSDDFLVAMSWMDSKPVHLLSTGVKNSIDYVSRRLKRGELVTLPACTPLTMYHKNMGGVDTHDYMRMGNYSMQSTYKMRKWYGGMVLSRIIICFTYSLLGTRLCF